MWNWRLLMIWGLGCFVTFLLMFGQIHIPLSLILFVALVAGLIGMAMRGVIADAGEMNAYRALAIIGAVGLVLRLPASCRPGASPSRRSPTSRPACGAASR